MKRPRVVFDLTASLEALLNPSGECGTLLRRFVESGEFELIVSEEILSELKAALEDPAIKRSVEGDRSELRRWTAALAVLATMVHAKDDSSRGDGMYLAAAEEAGGGFIVTTDPEFLTTSPPSKVEIVAPQLLTEVLEAGARL